jgi:hypothetical protein
LRHDQAQLDAEVEGLRWQAYLFDQQAARVDQAAALHPGSAS